MKTLGMIDVRLLEGKQLEAYRVLQQQAKKLIGDADIEINRPNTGGR